MGVESILTGSAYPWLLISALFAGAGLDRATRGLRGLRARADAQALERMRVRKWVFFSLNFSLALLFTLCALFIPGPAGFGRPPQLLFYLVATGLFFLAFRFRKSFGVIFFLLLLALAATLFLFVQSLNAFTGETEIARVRVLSVEEDVPERAMTLELTSAEAEPRVLRLQGVYFAPLVRVIIFEDYLVFLGRRSWYRFEGLTSFDEDFRQQDIELLFHHSFGISRALWDFYQRHESEIPAVKSVQVEMDLKRVREFTSYSLMLQNDGGLQILALD